MSKTGKGQEKQDEGLLTIVGLEQVSAHRAPLLERAKQAVAVVEQETGTSCGRHASVVRIVVEIVVVCV